MNGTKHDTEAADCLRFDVNFGRRALQAAAKGYGQRTLERLQVTMPERVDDKTGENPVRRKPKGSWGR